MSQLNFFGGRCGKEFPIGVSVDKRGSRTSMWYLFEQKRVYLDEEKLVHLRTLPAKGTSPKVLVWAYPEEVNQFSFRLQYPGGDHKYNVFAQNEKEAKNKTLYRIAKEQSLRISDLTRMVNNHPEYLSIIQTGGGRDEKST